MKFLNYFLGLFLAIFLTISFVNVNVRTNPIAKQSQHQVIELERGVGFTVLGERAYAQEAPAPAAEEVAEPNYLDKILAALAASGGLLGGLMIVFEMLMRAFPSKKPLSLLIPARYALSGLATIMKFLADVCDKLINIAQNAPKPPLK
jgi:hypothetical protein